jgi:phytanoyl-CoA hydroxylase
MKNEVTEDQVRQYRENGFLAIEGFLDAGELERWRSATQEAVDQRLESSRNVEWKQALNNQADPDAYYAQVFTQCLKLADTHPVMHELMHDERLGRLAGSLAGVDGIRIWHDQALFKPPFGNPTAWHLDDPYWSFDSRDAISTWVALDDATLGNGCMWYIPGSQKTATYENAGIGQNLSDLFKIYPKWREIEPVAVPVPAGSAVLHNGLTAHGAGANMTNKPRRAMTCAYMPDGCVFNGKSNVLPASYLANLKPGDRLNDSSINPLIWSVGTN